jgi:hypothetical protein
LLAIKPVWEPSGVTLAKSLALMYTLMVKLSIPYTAAASKNRKFQWKSHKHLNPEYAAFVANVELLVRNKCLTQSISFKPKTKTWVHLVLVKTPRMTRTDASNFLESICDGVKKAIGVDDCLFAGSFDWLNGPEALFQLEVSQTAPPAATG